MAQGRSSRGREVLELLGSALEMAGWATPSIRNDKALGSVLVACPDVGGDERLSAIEFVLFDIAMTEAGAGELPQGIVIVHDDADGSCPGSPVFDQADWLTPSTLISLAAGHKVEARELRLGRDFLFPFLSRSNGRNSPLTSYAESVEKENAIGIGLGARLAADDCGICLCEGDPPTLRAAKTPENWDYLPERKSLEDIVRSGIAGERLLVAVHEADEAIEFMATYLYSRHVEAVSQLDDASDRSPPTRLPILLMAEDIWALGYQRTIREEVWRSTRISFTAEVIRRMMGLGYLHVYLPNVERLRLDTDLDPNTSFVSDILASAGQWGGFTLGCQRYHIFHFPTFEGYGSGTQVEGARDSMLLRTMGERFARDRQLRLYDLGAPRRQDLLNLDAIVEQRAKQWSAEVAELCGARLGFDEARSLLLSLSIREVERNGSLIPKSDLADVIRMVVTGERRRPEHLTYIETAVLGSGALRLLDSGHIAMASPLLSGALLAKHFGKKFREAVQTGKWEFMAPVLDIARLPFWIIRWGLTGAGLPTEAMNKAVVELLVYYGITRVHGPREANQRENLISLLLATIDVATDWTARKQGDGVLAPEEEPTYVLEKINQAGGVHAVGISIPQRIFHGLKLEGWEFRDCNLRAVVFAKCDLGGTTFNDCFLGGARFLGATFSEFTCLFRSDMSGSLLTDAGTLTTLNRKTDNGQYHIDSLTLSSASIEGDGIDAAFRRKLVDANCVTLGLLLRNTATNARASMKKEDEEVYPDDYFEALGRHAWMDQAGAVVVSARAGSKDRDRLVRSEVLVSDRYASGWPARIKPRIVASGQLGNGQVLLAVDENGRCAYADRRLTNPIWIEFGNVPGAQKIAVELIEGESSLLIAIASAPGMSEYAPVHLFELRRTLSDGQISGKEWGGLPKDDVRDDVRGEVTALRWLERGTGDQRLLNLAIGFSSGSFMLFQHDGSWKRLSIAEDVRSSVSAIGYSKFNNVILVCHADGQTVGYRRSKAANLHTLFKFHSAHRRVYDVVPLGQRGQSIIVGSQQTTDAAAPGKRFQSEPMLCLLLNTAGAVLAVYPHPTQQLERANGDYAIPSFGQAEDLGAQGDVEDIARAIKSYSEKNDTLVFRSGKDAAIELILNNTVSNAVLPASVRDGASRRFREIGLVIADADAEFEQRFNESDLDDVRADETTSISVRASVAFPPSTRRATARLRINYLDDTGDANTALSREWPFTIDIERDYNPFTADGTPVSGEQFFGLDDLVDNCMNLLVAQKIVVVNSRRRAGKTSFFHEVSRRIKRNHGGAVDRLSVIVSGENAHEGRGLITEIARQIEALERTTKEYNGLAATLRSSSSSGTRDDSDVRRLASVAEAVKARGLPLPIVVFIDEWGLVARKRVTGKALDEEANDAIVSAFMAQAAEVAQLGVAFCLTSVPDDFRVAATQAESNPYRYAIDPWLEINPLSPEETLELIRVPLEKPEYSITADAAELVARLSSGVPDDANRMMHYALNALRSELILDPKRNKKEFRVIDTKHVHAAEPEQRLLSKYRDQIPSLINGMSRAEQELLFSKAGNAGTPAAWDLETPIPIKRTKLAFGEQYSDVWERLGQAGYRILRDKRQMEYKVWIPYGLTLAIRERRDADNSAD